MLTNKKIMVVATTDNMIWQFLIPHIQHLQRLGNTVECVCAKTGFWFDELQTKYGFVLNEINFARNPIKPQNIKGFKQLVNLQKQEKFEVIYCQQPVGGVMGRKLAKKFHLPCIYTAHGFHFYKGCPLINKLVYKPIEKHYAKCTTALITINNEDYAAAKGFKAKSVYKINGIGVDLTKYSSPENFNRTEFRKSLGLDENDFVVLSIGELNKNKNTCRLLEIFKNIENKNVKYLVCGQGPLMDKYNQYINENHLNDCVKMLGFRKDIPEILAASDAFIMPSLREGLPKSMMEAMSAGLPLLGSKIRGITDLIGDKGGLLFNPTQNQEIKAAIEKLADNKDLCKEYGDRNREYVKNFSIDVVIQQLEEIYKEV